MAKLQAKYSHEPEYLQAVHEVLESIEEVYNQHPEFEKAKIVERIVYPSNTECEDSVWLNDSLYDFSFLKLWVLVVNLLD